MSVWIDTAYFELTFWFHWVYNGHELNQDEKEDLLIFKGPNKEKHWNPFPHPELAFATWIGCLLFATFEGIMILKTWPIYIAIPHTSHSFVLKISCWNLKGSKTLLNLTGLRKIELFSQGPSSFFHP